jgi:hypothetical protein
MEAEKMALSDEEIKKRIVDDLFLDSSMDASGPEYARYFRQLFR